MADEAVAAAEAAVVDAVVTAEAVAAATAAAAAEAEAAADAATGNRFVGGRVHLAPVVALGFGVPFSRTAQPVRKIPPPFLPLPS